MAIPVLFGLMFEASLYFPYMVKDTVNHSHTRHVSSPSELISKLQVQGITTYRLQVRCYLSFTAHFFQLSLILVYFNNSGWSITLNTEQNCDFPIVKKEVTKGIRTRKVYFTLLSHAQGQFLWCEARDPKGRGLYTRTIARGHVIECEVHLTGPDSFSNTVLKLL